MLKIGDRVIYVPAKEYKGIIINTKIKSSGYTSFNVIWDSLSTHKDCWYSGGELILDINYDSKNKYAHLFKDA